MRIYLILLIVILRGSWLFSQQTQISATSLLRPGGTNRVLTTNSLGNVEWTTYSNVMTQLGGITGSGTINTLAMFTGANTIGNGPLSTASGLLISTQSLRLPNSGLQIGDATQRFFSDGTNLNFSVGGINRFTLTPFGRVLALGNNSNIAILGGNETMTNTGNVILGGNAGISLTTGEVNVFAGWRAGQFATTGSYNNYFGSFAGYNNPTGSSNNAFGNEAGMNSTSSSSNFFGFRAGRDATGVGNNFFGYAAGLYATGNYNVFMGYDCGITNTSGDANVYIGHLSGVSSSGNGMTGGNGNVLLGKNAVPYSFTGSNQISINNLIYANSAQNVGIGISNPNEKLHLNGKLQLNALKINAPTTLSILDNGKWLAYTNSAGEAQLTDILLANDADGISFRNAPTTSFSRISGDIVAKISGTERFRINTSGIEASTIRTNLVGTTDNVGLMFRTNNINKMQLTAAGRLGLYGFNNNTFVGDASGNETLTGDGANTAIGVRTLSSITTSSFNFASGWQAGFNVTTSPFNIFIGANAGINVTTGTGRNVIIGFNDGAATVTTGNDNTLIGVGAGANTGTGVGNTFIGASVSPNVANPNNTTLLGRGATAGSGELALGANNQTVMKIDATTITPQNSRKFSGQPTTGMLGSDLITETQATATYGGTFSNASPTGTSFSLPFVGFQDIERRDLTGLTGNTTINLTGASLRAGGIYVFAFYNKPSVTLTWSSEFKNVDGTAMTNVGAGTVSGTFRFYSDGTNLYQQ